MSMKALREAVKADRDTFKEGTVIRWNSGGCTYAALKATPTTWYTTARQFNPYVEQVLTFKGLLEVLMDPSVTDVRVATEWTDPLTATDD